MVSLRLALRPLKELYGSTPAVEFGPLALETVREQMIDAGVTRERINQHIGRIRRMFKWAVSKELIPVTTYSKRRSGSAALIGQKVQRSGVRGSILIGLGVDSKKRFSSPMGEDRL